MPVPEVSSRIVKKLAKLQKIVRKCKESNGREDKLKYLERLRQSSLRESQRDDGNKTIVTELEAVASQLLRSTGQMPAYSTGIL